LGSNVPFGGDDGFRKLRDLDAINTTAEFSAGVCAISPNCFQLLQMPLTRGRVFAEGDSASAPGVAIVNETLARKLRPGGDVLGRRLALGAAPNLREHRIVGVVAGARSAGTTAEIWDEVSIPYVQSNTSLYAIQTLDAPTFIGAAVVMVVVGSLAAYVPAARAARVDPLVALRHE
jgi:hypothetical protein